MASYTQRFTHTLSDWQRNLTVTDDDMFVGLEILVRVGSIVRSRIDPQTSFMHKLVHTGLRCIEYTPDLYAIYLIYQLVLQTTPREDQEDGEIDDFSSLITFVSGDTNASVLANANQTP